MTQEELKEILHYDPETGKFTCLKTVGSRMWKGKVLNPSPSSNGYLRVRIKNELYYLHRLAHLYMTGAFPPDHTDHKDLNRENNKWENIREATSSENHANIEKHIDNTSGLKGVWWSKRRQIWIAQIMRKGIRFNLGEFADKTEAKTAYDKAALELFKEFARS